MDKRTFLLTDGNIVFDSSRLLISDKARMDRLLLIINSTISIILAISFYFKWLKNNDNYYLVLGLILLIVNLALLVKWYKEFMCIDNTIELVDIVNVKWVDIKFSKTKICLIKTKKNLVRRVKIDFKNTKTLSNFFLEKGIVTRSNIATNNSH
jgi:ribosomal protein S18